MSFKELAAKDRKRVLGEGWWAIEGLVSRLARGGGLGDVVYGP